MSNTGFYIIIALAFGAMWFMSRRTRKQQQAAQEFRNTLQPGDEVMTGSGLFGTVVEVEGDVITLESTPGSRTRWLRAAISKKIEPVVAEIGESDDDEDELIDVPDDISSLEPLPTQDSTRPAAGTSTPSAADEPGTAEEPTTTDGDRPDREGGPQTK
ncbi:preprotein translocase subunit YajC [Cellulomonas sp. SG140]|uniref:preprotein translocase subunit YajC n=1 Tax=Cellulomonas sp. SG140 TaxID=2976536 RepID=UPI0021E8672F|nr:preprotein translocase subunit YajC [Cellulomonas sp. SG140]